jgi:hypothetical protein
MNLHRSLQAALLASSLTLASPGFSSTTYTYTDAVNGNFSGSFRVDSALANGTYSLLAAASRPAGFVENFFTASFVDGQGVTRTPSLSLFDITIDNGAVSLWDIRASTLFTSVTYSGGKSYVKVYHQNSTLIYHDTNMPYLPGGGLAYQLPVTGGDYTTYYTAGFAYQESLTGARSMPGVWSIASSAPAVPEPESYALLLAGLGAVVFITRRR